ncbi:MAG: carbon starvation protein A [Thermoguttaceae bacterium]|nr:carbon starvation protein A [Thermoguttaceae bacterium]MBR6481437.1 carbon starvation protein A [Thermoguttaceae bacterium]
MHLFLFGLVLLILGYMVYGKIVERIFAPDDRPTPAVSKADGVDYVVLPKWKNALIQLLNIAGIGPVIGVILGIKFGSVVFLIIPVGCVLGGAVHDFAAGMMSIRAGGANLPTLVRSNLGRPFASIFSVFMAILLILVVTVFINVPASLVNGMLKAPPAAAQVEASADGTANDAPAAEPSDAPNALVAKTAVCLQKLGVSGAAAEKIDFFWVVVGIIFLYYVVATLFPVDAIIGRVYPFFGGVLLLGTVAIMAALLIYSNYDFDILVETDAFHAYAAEKMPPLIPCLFVTIACGILSGFHATQAPIIARTIGTEREARFDFYGMMITEGIIAMVWAAGALAVYNLFPEYLDRSGTDALSKITGFFLGGGLGGVTIIAVVILAVTSGDTALRSLRLSVSEILRIPQSSLHARLLVVSPFIAVIAVLLFWSNSSPKSFGELWNYFAWGNQVIASATLMAATVWLKRQGKKYTVTFLPGLFMTFIVLSFILWTSKAHGGPMGLGLPLKTAYAAAAVLTAAAGLVVLKITPKEPETAPAERVER